MSQETLQTLPKFCFPFSMDRYAHTYKHTPHDHTAKQDNQDNTVQYCKPNFIRQLGFNQFYHNCNFITSRFHNRKNCKNYNFLLWCPASISTNAGQKTPLENITAIGEILVYFRFRTSSEGAADMLTHVFKTIVLRHCQFYVFNSIASMGVDIFSAEC